MACYVHYLMGEIKHEKMDCKINEPVENAEVAAFLKDIHAVCKKHGLCIEHEDSHGSFIIGKYYNVTDFRWLESAHIGVSASNA